MTQVQAAAERQCERAVTLAATIDQIEQLSDQNAQTAELTSLSAQKLESQTKDLSEVTLKYGYTQNSGSNYSDVA